MQRDEDIIKSSTPKEHERSVRDSLETKRVVRWQSRAPLGIVSLSGWPLKIDGLGGSLGLEGQRGRENETRRTGAKRRGAAWATERFVLRWERGGGKGTARLFGVWFESTLF